VIKFPQSVLVVTLHPPRVDTVMMGRTSLCLTIAGATITGAVSVIRGGNNNTCRIRRIDNGFVDYRWGFLVNSISGSGNSVNGCRDLLRIIVSREVKRLTPPAVLLV
jgi:hypothetical protein